MIKPIISLEINCGPLSVTRVVGIQCRASIDFSTVFLLVEVVEVSFCISTKWEK